MLWNAFDADEQSVLLIDEVDKADIEFPNDLLRELDRMEFYVYETQQLVKARHRPLVIITSNNEKELPDAFLRRCFSITSAFRTRKRCSASWACIFRPQEGAAQGSARSILRDPRRAGTQEEAIDVRAA
jgi:MoxR-like ATPase